MPKSVFQKDKSNTSPEYEEFLNSNRLRINKRQNLILWFCVGAGPLIALAIHFKVFWGVTYLTAVFVSVFMASLALIHRFLIKKFPGSVITSMIALFAINVLLFVMNSAHLTIYVCWFLIPLLSLQFCDYKLYLLSVFVNYGFMVAATWHIAPYFAERRTDVATPVAYFASRLGGLTMEMIVMIFAGYSLCRMITGYYRDLIENRKTIHDKELERERAVAASEAKSLFLSNMSHEIRTPINAVLGMNEMILRESEDENISAYSESIKVAGSMLLGLINDILDFSRIEAGKMEILPVDYDLSSVVNDLVNMVQTRADEKGLALELDFDRTIPKILHGDEVRIKQVITNILTNAVKYTEKGTVTFRLGYEKPSDEPDHILLRISVEDTGIGIKEEDMGKLLSEFERIEEIRNRKIEGTGLGLSITGKLLEMMGSRLEVESRYGEGSRFRFNLKQKVVKWEELGDYESAYQTLVAGREKYREKFTAPSANVLVVDDNPMNLVVFKSLLKQTRVKIETADSGNEGILLTQDKKYDMIFLDHMMPEKDGIQTLHEIRGLTNNPNIGTPAVCLTANAISGAREQYLSEGFDDYLTKPIDAQQLEEMLLVYLPKDKIMEGEKEQPKEEKREEVPSQLTPLLGSPIDVETGIKNSGSAEAYLPLLKIFYESMKERTGEIGSYYEKGDLENYTIKVHALKSSARIIGAEKLGELAQKLEDAGKAKDMDYINREHAFFMESYRSLGEPLSKVFVNGGNAGEKPPADRELMESVCGEIRSAAEQMDCDRLESIFAEMEEYRVPEAFEEKWNGIRDAADKYDYDAILEWLNK
ncbi:MAG: response regulator [Lachnospiraceae bacterium]|nr:response regulator [Lachnospiraceae bacterium]